MKYWVLDLGTDCTYPLNGLSTRAEAKKYTRTVRNFTSRFSKLKVIDEKQKAEVDVRRAKKKACKPSSVAKNDESSSFTTTNL